MAGIEPQNYLGPALTPVEEVTPAASAMPAPVAQVPVEGFLRGTALQAQTDQGRIAASRESASYLESAGAAVSQWGVFRLKDYFAKPNREPEVDFDAHAALNEVGMRLSEDEYEFLLKTTNRADFDDNLRRVEDERMASEAMGDNITASIFASVADPSYLGIDFGAARIARGMKAGIAAQRAAGAAVAGAGAGAITYAESELKPMGAGEALAQVLLNAAGGATLVNVGGKLVRQEQAVKGLEDAAGYVADPSVARKIDGADPIVPPNPKVLTPDTAADQVEAMDKSWSARFADRFTWSAHKSMAAFSPEAADILLSNARNMTTTSVEDIRHAVRSEWATVQYEYEGLLRESMAAQGAGWASRLFNTRNSVAVQADLELKVRDEMLRREQLSRQGIDWRNADVDPAVTKMADKLDQLSERVLKSLQDAGVEGAEGINARAGWFRRQWNLAKIEDLESRFVAAGKDAKQAHQAVVRMIGQGLRRANGWDDVLAYDIAASIVDRTKRKGYFEDAAFHEHLGGGTAAELRDALQSIPGITPERVQRALDVVTGATSERAKAGFLKHRLDIDYKAGVVVDGQTVRVADLIDGDVATLTEKYLDSAAAQVAFAQKGLRTAADIQALRSKVLHGVPDQAKRAEAAELFDNVVKSVQGLPVGEDMNRYLRMGQAWTRTIGLANSGILQATEYVTMAERFGLATTLKHFAKELPGLKSLLTNPTKEEAASLKTVLSRMSSQDVRLRPFIKRLEDNYEVPASDALQLVLQQAQQAIPFINGMKYVHHHQANMAAGLIVERLMSAAKGNAKAIKALAEYGLDAPLVEKIKADLAKHGDKVDSWSSSTWNATRPIFVKMMDEVVLKNRIGDIPAFAQFDKVGKFVFSFRSFVLGAHNKVLMGTIGRHGMAAASLLMLYQFPLAMMATTGVNALQGKPPLKESDLITKTISNMGALGLFSEVSKVATGQLTSTASPALMSIDRTLNTATSVLHGEAGKATAGLITIVPLLPLVPGVRALANSIKE